MLESDKNPESSPATPRKRAPRKATAQAGAPGPTASANTAAEASAPRKRAPRKAPARKAAPGAPPVDADTPGEAAEPAKKAPAKRTRKAAATTTVEPAAADTGSVESGPSTGLAPTFGAPEAPAQKTTRKRVSKKAGDGSTAGLPAADELAAATPAMTAPGVLFMAPAADEPPARRRVAKKSAGAPAAPTPVLADDSANTPQADAQTDQPAKRPRAARKRPAKKAADIDTTTSVEASDPATAEDTEAEVADPDDVREAAIEQATGARRRRRRGRRGRGGGSSADGAETADEDGFEDESQNAQDDSSAAESDDPADPTEPGEPGEGTGSRRRRRRRRSAGGGDDDTPVDDPPNTVTHVREPKKQQTKDDGDDGVRGVKGSTRLEAKRQRRRDGRETTRRRAPILTESEFLARREAVDRVMAVRQNGDRTQIAVLEDGILVEHYVTRASATSYVGNVYLGRVQNVLPSMEAAFIDISKGRNGVLYAGEVNWDAAGLEGKSRAIEQAMKSGDPVLVQVTKDPIGHKGARLTSQVSLPGRYLVYVPGGGMTGISRRLPDTERHRLKAILKKIVPEDAGVIVRTAAEGASEQDLTHDVERLQAQWETIREKAAAKKSAPVLVHGEPDLAIRVVRDVFNEDFKSLVVAGEGAWQTVSEYVGGVAPDLAERVSKHVGNSDLFHDLRVDEQLMKALDRKVWLPSGGSLVIDRTEAMTVVDVNTGKYVGSGGNLEQTVTRNNLEAAEEIVRQLRLRDVGGIVVIDFIDMVLESNRELVLRRLTECLGRDRTKHQVAEVTSLGLVQMTRKRVGEGLLEAFSEPCEHCHGRGVLVHTEPVDQSDSDSSNDEGRQQGNSRGNGQRRRGGRGGGQPEPAADADESTEPPATPEQRAAATAAIAAIHRAAALEQAENAAGSVVDELAGDLVLAAMKVDSFGTVEPVDPPASGGSLEAADPTREAMIGTAAVDGGITGDGADPAVVTQPDEPVETSEPNGAAASGRRRRRAASRPAGPPVATTA